MKTTTLAALALAALTRASLSLGQELPPPETEPAPPAPPSTPSPEAQPTPGPQGDVPWLLHIPVLSGTAREPLQVRADVRAPDQVEALTLRYRVGERGTWRAIPFRRSAPATGGSYLAVIPAPPLGASVVEYYLTLRPRSGAERDAFASIASPHVVVLHRTEEDDAERRRLLAAGGTRSTVELRGDWVDFGTVRESNALTCPTAPCRDSYYRLEASFRYRFFRTVNAIRFGVGTMRGTTPRPGLGSQPGGLDYGFADLELRLSPSWTVLGRAILGANEDRVQPGFGIFLETTPTHATRLTLGYEGVVNVGSVVSGWLRWETVPRTPMGAGVEVTNFPGDEVWGVRLLVELGRRFGPLTVGVRGGYQARTVDAGGVTLGGQVAFDF